MENFELVINDQTFLVTKANFAEETWQVINADHRYSFYMPHNEKWSPIITINCAEACDVQAELERTLEFTESKPDPLIPR